MDGQIGCFDNKCRCYNSPTDFRVWKRTLDVVDIALLRIGVEDRAHNCLAGVDVAEL